MRHIIAGTRTIDDYDLVARIIRDSGWQRDITEVVTGCSERDVLHFMAGMRNANVDILGAVWGRLHGLPVTYFEVTPVEWRNLGRKAGPLRNGRMANYGERLILVWDGVSRGSKSMLDQAILRGLDYYAPPLDAMLGAVGPSF